MWDSKDPQVKSLFAFGECLKGLYNLGHSQNDEKGQRLIDSLNESYRRLLAEREHYYKAAVTIEREVCEILADGLKYKYDEEYGWVIGDHVSQSLAAEAVNKLKDYREMEEDYKELKYRMESLGK